MLQNFTLFVCLWICLICACRQTAKKETATLPPQTNEQTAVENQPDVQALPERTALPPTSQAQPEKQTANTQPKTDKPKPQESAVITERKDFEWISAEEKSWTSGVASGGMGTDYYISVKITTDSPISFQSLWVSGKVFTVSIGAMPGTAVGSQSNSFKNGDTITLRATELINKQGKTNAQTAQPPITHNGAALLGYMVNGAMQYYAIPTMKKTKSEKKQ